MSAASEDQLPKALAQLEEARAEIHQLEAALQSSRTIGIAVGVLAERYEIEPDRAFALLTRISQTSNRKIRAIAEEFVTTGQLADLPAERRPPIQAKTPPHNF